MFLAIAGLTFAGGTNAAQAGHFGHSDEAAADDSGGSVCSKSSCCVLKLDHILTIFRDLKLCNLKLCNLNLGCIKHVGCCSAAGEEDGEEAPSASEDVPEPPAVESEARSYRGPSLFRFTNIRR
jgi:hypothetical protein